MVCAFGSRIFSVEISFEKGKVFVNVGVFEGDFLGGSVKVKMAEEIR